MLSWAGLATADAGGAPGPQRLDRLRREIRLLSAERDRFVSREKGVLGRLDRLAAEARLLDAQREKLRLELDAARQALEQASAEETAAGEKLAGARGVFRGTVLLLHRIGPFARLRPLLDAPDADRLAAALRLSHELSSSQRQQVAAIQQGLAELARIREERESRRRELTGLEQKADAAREELSRTIRSRRALLRRIREEKQAREAALGELKRASEELSAIISGLSPPREIALDVRKFRGLLERPVKARVSIGFGDRRDSRFGTVIPHRGWDLGAEFGMPVKSPFAARVAFADWFRGYGLVVVLDHGHGIHTVYAHLSAVQVHVGDKLDAGQTIGRVGDTGSLKGPYLYLEVREGGKAVDPARWFRPR